MSLGCCIQYSNSFFALDRITLKISPRAKADIVLRNIYTSIYLYICHIKIKTVKALHTLKQHRLLAEDNSVNIFADCIK